MVFGKLLFKKEKHKEEEEEAPPPDVRGFTVAEIWDLKMRLHEATRDLDQQAPSCPRADPRSIPRV